MLTKSQKGKILKLVQTGIQKQEIAKLLKISATTITSLLATRIRTMVVADSHCGHVAGLTPPKWHQRFSEFYPQQVEMWDWYSSKCKELKPDTVLALGDLIDGKGKLSGGTEQITTSIKEQLKMAECCIQEADANEVIGVYGTPYHVGMDEDYESFIKNVKMTGHDFPLVHGIQFDIKHKIGVSSIPHGRYTALAKSRMWNQLWNDIEGQPKADIVIRAHTHYFEYCGNNRYLAMICPALSGWGSKFGVRQCEGIVNTGLIWFDIYDGTDLSNLQWRFDVPSLETQKVLPYRITKKEK